MGGGVSAMRLLVHHKISLVMFACLLVRLTRAHARIFPFACFTLAAILDSNQSTSSTNNGEEGVRE